MTWKNSTSRRIIEAVASIENVKSTDLEPLHDVIDPESLDHLFSDASNNLEYVRFDYCDHRVEIDGQGHISIDGVPLSAPSSENFDDCDSCGKDLQSQTWYPVLFTDHEETKLRSFCGEACLKAWKSENESDNLIDDL